MPRQFVIKNTLGGGGNSVIIVKDKESLDLEYIRDRIGHWTYTPAKNSGGREWPYYSGRDARIIIEEYLEDENGDLPDIKLFCFEGKCKFFFIRHVEDNHSQPYKIAFFDDHLNFIPDFRLEYSVPPEVPPAIPENIREIIQCAETLSSDFPHARIDLYNVRGKIYFGEITFFHASGYVNFFPDELDKKIGSFLPLIKYKP